MQRLVKLLLFCVIALAAFFSNGCIDKTFFPATELQVTSVEPYALIPTATDTASLPTTEINILSQSKIPCSLKSISATYFTALGEEIQLLAINNQQTELKIDAEASVKILFSPYSSRLVELFELSASEISPVKVRITMNFLDINNNWVSTEAHCLLYKYVSTTTSPNRKPNE